MQNDEIEEKKLKIGDFTVEILFVIISLCLLVWFNTTNNLFEKIIALGIFLMFIIPSYAKIYSFKLSKSLKPRVQYQVDGKGNITERKNESKSKNYNKEVDNSNSNKTYKKKYKSREIDNPNYINLRNCIIASSKNGLFTREDILLIKATINTLLGSHQFIYTDFAFENDLMEIYSKIKSSKMTDESWLVLLNLVNEINSKVVE